MVHALLEMKTGTVNFVDKFKLVRSVSDFLKNGISSSDKMASG